MRAPTTREVCITMRILVKWDAAIEGRIDGWHTSHILAHPHTDTHTQRDPSATKTTFSGA